jgi:hypothetical protein
MSDGRLRPTRPDRGTGSPGSTRAFRPERAQLPQHETEFRADRGGFAAIGRKGQPKIRVGIVGEIYIKYAPAR